MRNAFAQEILEIARRDSRLIVLSADIGNRLFDKLKSEFPSRFYNTGVAVSGFCPICYTITPFITYRCYEQIRIDICYHEMPVVIVGTGAGLSYASLGATHHSCEDIAIMRVLPGMHVAAPADAQEVKACLRAAINLGKPVYIRIGKKGEPVLYEDVPDFEFGRWSILQEGSNVCLLSTGNMIANALESAKRLKEKGVDASVVNCASIKPLDEDMLREIFNRFNLVATIEEHSLIGGFGSAVTEWAVDHRMSANNLIRFGTKDVFLHQLGEQQYARKQHGLDSDTIVGKILNCLAGV